MGKAIITLEDRPDGGIKVGAEFDPPAIEGSPRTPAQSIAVGMIEDLFSAIENAKIGKVSSPAT